MPGGVSGSLYRLGLLRFESDPHHTGNRQQLHRAQQKDFHNPLHRAILYPMLTCYCAEKTNYADTRMIGEGNL